MLRTIMAAFFLLLSHTVAIAQDWPRRPVRLVAPYPAGGGVDIIARVLAQKLGEALGQRFIVENKPGASGTIGTQSVANGDLDGYSFVIATPAEISIARTLFKDLAYDPLTDLAPVVLLAWTPLVLAAHPSFEASTIGELVTLSRALPINVSTPGVGTSHHLAGEYINRLQSTKLVLIPYRGAAPAVSDVVGGQIKLTISGMPPVVPFLQTGSLKAIAVTSKQRSPTFPAIPALAETQGFEAFDFTNWFGLFARAGTSELVLDKLAKASAMALKDAQVREILKAQAAEPVGNTPAEFRDFIRAESAKYATIVEITGLKVK